MIAAVVPASGVMFNGSIRIVMCVNCYLGSM